MDWVNAGNARYPSLDRWLWSWTSAAAIAGTPYGPDGTAVAWMTDGTRHRLYRFSGALTFTAATVGVNGVHNDHTADAASTGWDIYGAVKAGTEACFAVPTGTTVNAAKMDGLGDGSYNWWTVKALWFTRNNASSNLITFRQIGPGECFYTAIVATPIAAGVATIVTAVDLSGLAPSCAAAHLLTECYNDQATIRDCVLWADSGGTQSIDYAGLQLGTGAGYARSMIKQTTAPIGYGSLATSLYYSWTGAPTTGLTVYVQGWRL